MTLKESSWVEVRVVVPPGAVEAISAFFFDRGSLGLTETEGTDPARGAYVLLQAYFDAVPFQEGAADFEPALRIALAVADAGQPRIWIDNLPFGNWAENWKKYFKPRKLGARVVVAPTWEEYAPAAGEIVVRIDPGMAFGTGQHETTTLCVKALEEVVTPGMRVLDVGTGTGILAIVGVLLGASSALGTDIDPEAITAARENVEANGLGAKVRIEAWKLEEIPERFPVVVANILAEALIAMAPALVDRTEPGGVVILSGILAHLAAGVREAFAARGFSAIDERRDGEWVCLVARESGRAG